MKTIYKLLMSVFLMSIFATSCEWPNEYGDYSGIQWTESGNEKYTDYGENPFIVASETPTSTFSVDNDGASYTVMRRYLNHGQKPPTSSVRIEEYINYFSFNYPEPADGQNLSVTSEVASCPWTSGHKLLRIGIKGKSLPENELPPTNYVFLIDVSGSMNSSDKIGILKSGFSALVDVLDARDKVAIVTYAGSSSVALQSTSCDEKDKIKNAIGKLKAGGSTAGGQGILTAYSIARDNFVAGGNNRIIIGTDGDFNVGPVTDDDLVELIEDQRDYGIYLTVLGVGSGNLNDSMLEKIANKGNGTYEYIDCVEQIEKVFVNERSRFYAIAKDCKVQVEFNPEVVERYRLIGYENRIMQDEDFEDDEKDAGEIGIGQSVTALYEIIPAESFSGMAADINIRYKMPDTENVMSLSTEIEASDTDIYSSSEDMRFAASVTAFGLQMKGSEYKGGASKALVLSLGENAIGYDPFGYRAGFLSLVKKNNF